MIETLGGYNFPNAARCWTYITATVLGKKLPKTIPEHEVHKYVELIVILLFPHNSKYYCCFRIFQFFLKYGPDYSLEISPHHFRENKNTSRYVKGLLSALKGTEFLSISIILAQPCNLCIANISFHSR